MDESDEDDVPTVILTPAQRRFLKDRGTGELDDMSDAAIRQTRYRIRERAKIALDDVELLSHLSKEDLDQIADAFREPYAGWKWDGQSALPFIVSETLDFFVRLFGEDVFTAAAERTVKKYREKELTRRQKVADVSVNTDVSVENVRTVDELKERYDAEEELTDSELFLLACWGRIPVEVYNEQGDVYLLEAPYA